MIQRIQTVYLLFVVGLLITAMCLPLGYFIDAETTYTFTSRGISLAETYHSSWGLFGILLLGSIITLACIFLYKNRVLQLRMTIFNSVLLVGFYLAFIAFYWVLKGDLEMSFQIHWALCFPLICIILNYLAIRAIGRDEVLVKAADRLR